MIVKWASALLAFKFMNFFHLLKGNVSNIIIEAKIHSIDLGFNEARYSHTEKRVYETLDDFYKEYKNVIEIRNDEYFWLDYHFNADVELCKIVSFTYQYDGVPYNVILDDVKAVKNDFDLINFDDYFAIYNELLKMYSLYLSDKISTIKQYDFIEEYNILLNKYKYFSV